MELISKGKLKDFIKEYGIYISQKKGINWKINGFYKKKLWKGFHFKTKYGFLNGLLFKAKQKPLNTWHFKDFFLNQKLKNKINGIQEFCQCQQKEQIVKHNQD